MKPMTAKEFKQILKDGGFYIFESENPWELLLNKLSILEYQQAEDMAGLNLMRGAGACRRRANYLYEILDARGFYDEIKNKAEEVKE